MQSLFLREQSGEAVGSNPQPRRLKHAYENLLKVLNEVGFELAVAPDEELPDDPAVTRHVFVLPKAARRRKSARSEEGTEKLGSSVVVTFGVDEGGHQHLSVTDDIIRGEPIDTLPPYQVWVEMGLIAQEFVGCIVSEPEPQPQLPLGLDYSNAEDGLRVAI